MEKRGCCARAKQGGGFVPPPCHWTIVGAEELLVMEFINSVHDRLSWGGGHNIVQFLHVSFAKKERSRVDFKSTAERRFWKCLCVSSMSFTATQINS